MTNHLVAVVLGAAVGAGMWALIAEVFGHPVLVRANVHGRPVPTAGGLTVVLAVVIGVAAVWLDGVVGPGVVPVDASLGWSALLTATLGFGLLGLVDDLLGDASSRGFRGHLQAMARGRLTTGGLKLVGGGVVALLAVLQMRPYHDIPGWLAVDVFLVALAANLANLFDRAPGRVTKVAVLVAVPLVVVAPTSWVALASVPIPPVAASFVVGAALGVLLPELRERMMLGDTGANVIGAALGLGAVGGLGQMARLVVLVALLVLNLASERVSFSRLITSTPGVRQFDQWGRARS